MGPVGLTESVPRVVIHNQIKEKELSMDLIRSSMGRWRSLAARLVVGPGHMLPALMAVALAGCDSGRVSAPDGGSATPIADAATVVASASAGGWEPIRIEVHFNFLTGQSTWTSTGAFVDFGSIDLAGTSAVFRGEMPTWSSGFFKVEQVISPIVASDGSTLTWTFAKTWTFTSEATLVSKAQWHFVGGTGPYAGITGHGDLVGDLDLVTGELNDVFTGWVRWP
jgi:hypothetical protein